MATVEMRGLCKRYGATEIIKQIDLTLHDRELTVFVGPSGCGKSTLLRLIAGLEEITAGDLLIDGQRVNDISPVKRGLALVFQSYALYPHMSVAENMTFSLKLAGVSKPERQKKVMEAARILHLEEVLDRKPKDLSGGQRQRVAIGRAIVRNPKIFLFDEPLSNLDAALRVHMRLELTKLHHQLNATMIYVTHDQIEAMTMADRIVVMQAGRIEQVGAPMELYRSPKNLFVAGFIGSPRMNFLPATVQLGGASESTLDVGGTKLHIPGFTGALGSEEELTLGVRPEHMSLVQTGGLPAQVQAVEHLGPESFLYAQTASGEALTARIDGATQVQAGQGVHLGFDPSSVHLFNAAGGAVQRAPVV